MVETILWIVLGVAAVLLLLLVVGACLLAFHRGKVSTTDDRERSVKSNVKGKTGVLQRLGRFLSFLRGLIPARGKKDHKSGHGDDHKYHYGPVDWALAAGLVLLLIYLHIIPLKFFQVDRWFSENAQHMAEANHQIAARHASLVAVAADNSSSDGSVNAPVCNGDLVWSDDIRFQSGQSVSHQSGPSPDSYRTQCHDSGGWWDEDSHACDNPDGERYCSQSPDSSGTWASITIPYQVE